MPDHLNKEVLLQRLDEVNQQFTGYCETTRDEHFFHQPVDKWSVAQNVTHLVTSANMTRLAYRLPKWIVRLYTGKPNRPGRSYDELVARYQSKLAQGGKASGRFVAKPVDSSAGKGNILHRYAKSIQALRQAIANTAEPDFDRYLAPHPLLGKITLRELAYFTIYHTLHHLSIIKERVKERQPA